MLRLVQLEEIEGLLLALPGLVRLQERRSPDFVAAVAAWLGALEQAFAANRLPLSGEVAAIRSSLVTAEQGAIPSGVTFRGQPTKSRVLSALGSSSLQSAAALASGFAREQRPRFAEAEALTRQMIAVARHRSLVPAEPAGLAPTAYLRLVRQAMASSPELESAVVRVEGLVGPQDALILLDRGLTVDALV